MTEACPQADRPAEKPTRLLKARPARLKGTFAGRVRVQVQTRPTNATALRRSRARSPSVTAAHPPPAWIDLQTRGQPGFCISAGFVKLLLSKPQDDGEVSPWRVAF